MTIFQDRVRPDIRKPKSPCMQPCFSDTLNNYMYAPLQAVDCGLQPLIAVVQVRRAAAIVHPEIIVQHLNRPMLLVLIVIKGPVL